MARNKTAFAEFLQKVPQLAFCLAQVSVMLESRKSCSPFGSRLLRINLPGVHVKQVGPLLPQHFPYGTGDVGRFRRLFEYEFAQTIKAVEFVES